MLGIKRASLYHHIAKKEDLLYDLSVESLERIHSEVAAAIAGVESPVQRLRALISAHMNAALADQDKHATMLIELRELSGERQSEVLRLRDAYEELVRDVILSAQDAGAVRRDISAKLLTLSLLNLLNWSIFWWRPEGELSAQALAELLCSVLLEGIMLD